MFMLAFIVIADFLLYLSVNWQGQDIATISLPPGELELSLMRVGSMHLTTFIEACAAANAGVPDYAPLGHLTITDLDA